MSCPPEIELTINKKSEDERKESDKLYAIKLVERIVFGGVALVLVSVATALIYLVIRR